MASYLSARGVRTIALVVAIASGQVFAQDPPRTIPRFAAPAHILLQDFEVEDIGEKFEARIRVVNPESMAVIAKGLFSFCTPKEEKLETLETTGLNSNAQCYERHILESNFEFPPVTPKSFTFTIPKPTEKRVTPSHVILKFGNEFDARNFEASRKIPQSSPDVFVLPIKIEASGISNLVRGPKTLYPPLMGISFEKDEYAQATIFVTNRNPQPLEVVGKLQIRRRTEFGPVVYEGEIPPARIPGSAKSFRLSFTLPKENLSPESYLASVQFYSAHKREMVSSIEDIRFINRGASATVQELSVKRAANGAVITRFKIYGAADSGDRHRPGTTPAGEVNGQLIVSDKKTGNKLASVPVSALVQDLEGTPVSITTPTPIDADDLEIRVDLVSQAVGPFSRNLDVSLPRPVKTPAAESSSRAASTIPSLGFAAIIAALVLIIGFIAWSRKKHGAA